MANTSALLGTLLNTKADINYFTQQQIYWSQRYEANQVQLQKQVKYEEQWQDAFDDAQNADKKCVVGGKTWKEKDQVLSDYDADKYAHAKVYQYDEALSQELADLDLEYDTMQTMYESLLQSLNAQKDSEKTAVQSAAQDTGLISS